MLSRGKLTSLLVVSFLLALSSSAFAQWTEFKSDEYGFRMLVPPGSTPDAHDYGDGWAGLTFKAGAETEVWAIGCKKAKNATHDEIAAFGVLATGIPAENWHEIPGGSGKNIDGFKWIESYTASKGKRFIAAILGTGPRAGYLILVATTDGEYQAHKSDFDKFFKSIKVF